MIENYTCTLCSMNCAMTADIQGSRVTSLKGNCCSRGFAFVNQAMSKPTYHVDMPAKHQGNVARRNKVDG